MGVAYGPKPSTAVVVYSTLSQSDLGEAVRIIRQARYEGKGRGIHMWLKYSKDPVGFMISVQKRNVPRAVALLRKFGARG